MTAEEEAAPVARAEREKGHGPEPADFNGPSGTFRVADGTPGQRCETDVPGSSGKARCWWVAVIHGTHQDVPVLRKGPVNRPGPGVSGFVFQDNDRAPRANDRKASGSYLSGVPLARFVLPRASRPPPAASTEPGRTPGIRPASSCRPSHGRYRPLSWFIGGRAPAFPYHARCQTSVEPGLVSAGGEPCYQDTDPLGHGRGL